MTSQRENARYVMISMDMDSIKMGSPSSIESRNDWFRVHTFNINDIPTGTLLKKETERNVDGGRF